MTPQQINTAGYTHLYFAFASINPATYQVEPADSQDEALYTQFTSLKSSTLQTWIAVGGGDFSRPGEPTFTTWSDMASDSGRRATFISSLRTFMEQYGFQGVDLDWEFPALPEFGGQPSDTANYVALVREMRAAFGTAFGISAVLPADWGSIAGYDPSGMQPYVDSFGFMAYDIHGTGENEPAVSGQADIRDIYDAILPLWYAGIDPAKVNLGIAWYGRGYTLSGTLSRRAWRPG